MLFVLMRLAAYAGLIGWLAAAQPRHPWWHWLIGLGAAAWGVWDRWKRPDDPPRIIRLGVWTEVGAICLFSLTFHDASVLFLLLSPLVRSAVHLPGMQALIVGSASLLCFLLFNRFLPGPAWLLPAQGAALLGMGAYAYVLGSLVRERDKARRLEAIHLFDKERRTREEERLRIAGRLHDTMGQYWTGVIRGLDVALLTEGEQQRKFILRAREAAMDGLQEMRSALRNWNDGRQTPEQWLEMLSTTVLRFREVVGVEVTFHQSDVDWAPYPDAPLVAETVARTAVEALTNAVRHGGASSVTIHLTDGHEGLLLAVTDDGSGLPRAPLTEGMGLRAMRDQAARIGAAWSIAPGDVGGAVVTLRVPPQRKELGVS